jgi:hypothetical protein
MRLRLIPSSPTSNCGQLGSRLTLPADWTFEVKTLDQDDTVDLRNSDGVAHLIRDEFHNVYKGRDFDAASNFVSLNKGWITTIL